MSLQHSMTASQQKLFMTSVGIDPLTDPLEGLIKIEDIPGIRESHPEIPLKELCEMRDRIRERFVSCPDSIYMVTRLDAQYFRSLFGNPNHHKRHRHPTMRYLEELEHLNYHLIFRA